MPNPLSDQGWSDRDYQGMIGTLVGEVARNGNLTDYQAIADVVANRLNDKAYTGQFGTTVASQTMNRGQFSAWSPAEKHANYNAKAGFAAALNPAVASRLSDALQDRVTKAQQAVADVFVNGTARGLTQNATAYHNAKETAKRGTGGWHEGLERDYGSVKIGAHTFTGQGFRADQPFDNVTYNGQLGIPDAALPNFDGVPFNENRFDDNSFQIDPVNFGTVDNLGPVSDLTSYENINPVSFNQAMGPPVGNFDWGGLALNDFSTDPLQAGFSLPDQAPVNLSDVWSPSPGMTEQQAIDAMGLGDQRLSENMEVRQSPYGMPIDERAHNNWANDETVDYLAAQWGGIVPGAQVNPASFTTDPYENLDQRAPHSWNEGLSYPDVTEGMYAPGPTEWSADFNPAPVNVSDVAVTSTAYDPTSWSTDVAPAKPDFSDVATPQVSGFHSGLDGWNADVPTSLTSMSTPDLEDKSLQNEMDMSRVNQAATTGWGTTLSGLNDQEADLSLNPQAKGAVGFGAFAPAPSAPAPAPASSYTSRASAPAPAASYASAPAPQRSAPAQAPQPQQAAPSLPSVDVPSYPDVIGQPMTAAEKLGKGLTSGWSVPGLIGGALGLATGNPLSAISGYQMGKSIGGLFDNNHGPSFDQAEQGLPGHYSTFGTPYDAIGMAMPHDKYMASQQTAQSFFDKNNRSWLGSMFGGFGNFGGFHGFDGYDASTMGYGEGFNARGERSPTGPDNSGNATVGDGSYGETSGVNDNNPQGIL